MTRPRRWRWWGKWATLTLAAAIALAWPVTKRYYAGIVWCAEDTGVAIYAIGGVIQFNVAPSLSAEASGALRPGPRLFTGRMVDTSWARERYPLAGFQRDFVIQVPLWALFLSVAITAAWLWRLDRKPEPGHCPRCRYDLSATPPSAPCPECGEGGRAQQAAKTAAP
jgi:hypothetical protein